MKCGIPTTGLIALLAGAAAARTRPAMAPFALAGLATMLLGLRTPDASFAALVLLLLLVLSQLAIRLAQGDGLVALLAAAGLSGLPPVGVFPALVLAVLAVVRTAPWLLVTLLPGLAALGWAAIIRLPAPRLTAADRRSLAWIPLAAALLLGWCLPAPGAAWLRAVAMEIHR